VSVDICERIILTVGHFTVIAVEYTVFLFNQITLLETAVGVIDPIDVTTVIDRCCDIVRIDLALRQEHQGNAFIGKRDL
jgi:hypothetical protein